MVRANSVRAALLVVTVVLVNLALNPVAFAESFDKPVRQMVVDFGPTPYMQRNSGMRIELTCSYYPAFVVKQLEDEGQKGTQWVTIVPIIRGDLPPCQPSHGSSERFIAKDGWFFIGAKGQLLFLEASEGDENAGMPFRVLDWKTGRKIFEDSAWWDDHLAFEHSSDERLSMRYLRVVGEDCSIPKGGASCWNKFREKFGLPLATVPKCTGYRQEGEKKWVVGDEGGPPEEVDTPSAIAYPVVVELFPKPSILAVPGPVKCTPVE
jgi:hypothetical protein